MFERRVIVLLVVVVVGCLALSLRAAQVQVVQRGEWERFLTDELNKSTLVQTTRGRLLDVNGVVLAEDEPCIDACVEFAALLPEPPEKWVNRKVRERLGRDPTFTRGDRAHWNRVEAQVRADHAGMWQRLAEVSGQSVEEVEARRREIVDDVLARRAHLTDRRYAAAVDLWEANGRPAWWRRWLLGESGERPARADYDEPISEERQHHVLLRDVTQDVQNRLVKLDYDLPGFTLMPGMRRVYPHGEATAHVIGRLGKVNRRDVDADPEADDRLRRYLPNDLAGRQGLERLAERRLRGTRGLEFTIYNPDGTTTLDRTDPAVGEDVVTTIDVALQHRVAGAFETVASPHVPEWTLDDRYDPPVWRPVRYEAKPMNGAAVVLDVATGQVRAMVSAPSFDPNRFDELYPQLLADTIDLPMLNRATQSPREVGSTMKVITGIGAMSDGLLGENETIHCDGYFYHDGKRMMSGRCWVMSMYNRAGHHDGGTISHPTSDLNLVDALQRSCNVFFETLGDRLGLEGLDRWQRAFGFGERTGVGISEHPGRTSGDFVGENRAARDWESWLNAIGQGKVAATPLQTANAIAAVARGGVWVQPTLLADAEPARRELPVTDAARVLTGRGMFLVSNSRAGTGTSQMTVPLRDQNVNVVVAAKTGSATSSRLTVEGEDGARLVPFAPTVVPTDDPATAAAKLAATADAAAPWYHHQIEGDGPKLDADGRPAAQSHAWYVGYAPAENPTIAFAVIIEYGGSGGRAAGSVAQEIIRACVDLGYLENPPAPSAEPEEVAAE